MNHCLILLLLLFCNGNNKCGCMEDCARNTERDSCGCGRESRNESCRNMREDSCRESRNESCREGRNESGRDRNFGSFTPGGTCGCEDKNV